MKAQLSAMMLFAAAAVAGYAQAQSEVFVCVGSNGTREYKNTGETKGCKRVDLQGVAMIPAPASVPYKKPAVQTVSAKTTSSPADFPRIDSGTQKARDNDRMQILADELKSEEKKLAALKQEYNNGEPERRGDERNYAKYQDRLAVMKEDLNRTEKNIEALKREMGVNLK
ncbi:MAG: hypothetical protein JWQ23_550 [Herminiimonas sp.]|nr:hypothetical protein [Herminiimonas sp.]